MSEQLRPSVTLTEQVQALVNSGLNPNVVTIIGVTSTGTAEVFQTFRNISDIEAQYGSNTNRGANAVDLARYAFRNGAGIVRLCSIGQPTSAQAATTLSAVALAGATSVTVTSPTGIATSDVIYIGSNIPGFAYEEKRTVSGVVGSVVSFTEPLQFDHVIGEGVSEITEKTLSDYQD